MIRSFSNADTAQLWKTGRNKRFANIMAVGLRKLDQLDAAASIEDMRAPPGNRLEKLKGNRAGIWSIRVNDQWRICFEWKDGDAWHVEIVDYH